MASDDNAMAREPRRVRWTTPASPDRLLKIYVVASCLVYVFVAVRVPIAVWATAPHDDTLFMLLGRYLANGDWLGPYNQFTLMKGPGYPAFLALSHFSGLSVTMSTALFHCVTVSFLVLVCRRILKWYLLSALLFTLLLW